MKKISKIIEQSCKRHYSPLEKGLITLCSFLLGMILGFYLSPIKKGVTVGCNNGNNNKVSTENPKADFSKKQIPKTTPEAEDIQEEEHVKDMEKEKKSKKAIIVKEKT